VELRQLRYFVMVAEELNFGRAAGRLHIAVPSLSQQIKQLELDLGIRLFHRDRRSVALTPNGLLLLLRARALLEGADALRRVAAGLPEPAEVRIGYVSWRPPDLVARAGTSSQIALDSWVLPSHVQIARVAENSLDLAICSVSVADLVRLKLEAHLIGAERLYAVAVGPDSSDVAAEDTTVLIDADAADWSTWNKYATHFAEGVGATSILIEDGGIMGPRFHDHVRRIHRTVLRSPRDQTDSLPPDLVLRTVVQPAPYWTWCLVSRQGDKRPAVSAVLQALTRGVGPLDLDDVVWLPETDPFWRGS
jgi:DNA-binding transcriptional LysR family regulator